MGLTTSESWTPSADMIEDCAMDRFRQEVSLPDFEALHRWSVENRAEFWDKTWDFCHVIGEKGDAVLENEAEIETARFFPGAKLNFAENLLRRRDDAPALIFKGEDQVNKTWSYQALYDEVSRIAAKLKAAGVVEGDRVAGYMPNLPETIIAMLATSSIGAIWSSASPDFGVQGVLDRFGQIEPKILFTVDGYFYNGKVVDCLGKLQEIVPQLPTLESTVVFNYAYPSDAVDVSSIPELIRYEDWIGEQAACEIDFLQLPFDHPLFIMFSSGTTGVPKCIVHGAGGTLLQHLKEHQLHCDVKKDDRVFYFTTCGWMMWNWLVTALASEAALLLYDGAPFYPDGNTLFDFMDQHGGTLFGTSAKFIDALKKEGYRPRDTHDLSTIRMLTSTGSPLVHEGFDYIYDAIKPDIHIASISGGTDIISCFVLGNPLSPVHRGEIQGAGLGMDIATYDEDGKVLDSGKGELVCCGPFPSQPVGFWNDPNGEKYHNAYFAKFPGVWCHGDWCEWTENGGMIIHGRSDATLNPGGVRIGTAEIYRQVEKLGEVKESIAVGQDWEDDVRVVLFVVLTTGRELTKDLVQKIKLAIRSGASPRHVPAKVIQVTDIPRTKSGKITELAVREMIHGRPVKNVEALANPEALDQYEDIEELSQ